MDLRNTVARPMLPEPWQRIVRAAILTVLSACLLFTVGCISNKPQIIGLKPESPELATCAALGPCPLFFKRESSVARFRPTFRWERFPRTADLAELGPHAHERIDSGLEELMGTIDVAKPAPHAIERITAVHYELRLWKVGPVFSGRFETPGTSFWIGSADDYKYSWAHECRDSDPGELVYSKQGLTSPAHQLETPLEPDSRYFWTVRAHFTLDGKRRATEWSEQLLLYPHDELQTWPDGCSSPAIFHLIRTQ